MAVTIDGSLATIKRVARREQPLGHPSLEELISVLAENGVESESDSEPSP